MPGRQALIHKCCSTNATAGSSLSIGAFALVWNAFVAFWTVSALAGGGLLFGLFSIPFWLAGGQLAKQALAGAFKRWVVRRYRTGTVVVLLILWYSTPYPLNIQIR